MSEPPLGGLGLIEVTAQDREEQIVRILKEVEMRLRAAAERKQEVYFSVKCGLRMESWGPPLPDGTGLYHVPVPTGRDTMVIRIG